MLDTNLGLWKEKTSDGVSGPIWANIFNGKKKTGRLRVDINSEATGLCLKSIWGS